MQNYEVIDQRTLSWRHLPCRRAWSASGPTAGRDSGECILILSLRAASLNQCASSLSGASEIHMIIFFSQRARPREAFNGAYLGSTFRVLQELYYYPKSTVQVTVVGANINKGLLEQAGLQVRLWHVCAAVQDPLCSFQDFRGPMQLGIRGALAPVISLRGRMFESQPDLSGVVAGLTACLTGFDAEVCTSIEK
jgi:hypothetical protein